MIQSRETIEGISGQLFLWRLDVVLKISEWIAARPQASQY
jgi:hypothetical protein